MEQSASGRLRLLIIIMCTQECTYYIKIWTKNKIWPRKDMGKEKIWPEGVSEVASWVHLIC